MGCDIQFGIEPLRFAEKERNMVPIHTVLHPTDFSERSAYALRLACALARDHGAKLVVLHVAAMPVAIYGEGVVLTAPTNYMDQQEEQLHQLPVPDADIHVERRLVEGDAAAEILRVAHEVNADLIVMGTHGRTGLARLLMGSVAEQVVRKAACPVLTVKTPFAANEPMAAKPMEAKLPAHA
jgi:nucleotide-binding universal stress UspA family protein